MFLTLQGTWSEANQSSRDCRLSVLPALHEGLRFPTLKPLRDPPSCLSYIHYSTLTSLESSVSQPKLKTDPTPVSRYVSTVLLDVSYTSSYSVPMLTRGSAV
jgi:hypothetical protein